MPPVDEKEATTQRIGVRAFRGNLSAYLREVSQGRSFLIMSHDEVLAEIRPPSKLERKPRRAGALRGRIRIAADFDVLPADVLAAMEGEEE